jgi:carboxypeptidase C (cathepsin A)
MFVNVFINLTCFHSLLLQTYLGGESFAGQWIPYFGMSFPLKHDAQLMYAVPANAMVESNLNIPVRGAAIGNGWIDPRRQYPAYLDFTVKVGILEENSEVSSCWFISQGHPPRRSIYSLGKWPKNPPTNVWRPCRRSTLNLCRSLNALHLY